MPDLISTILTIGAISTAVLCILILILRKGEFNEGSGMVTLASLSGLQLILLVSYLTVKALTGNS